MVESFIDELAAAAKKDPIEYRRALLATSPRARAVLDLAAEKAGWGPPRGIDRGAGAVAGAQEAVCYVDCVKVVSLDRPLRGDADGVREHRARYIEGGEVPGFGRSVRGRGCPLSVQLQAFEINSIPNNLLKNGKAGT
jgi:CO/xanthine dehydrogenase Mo-binding subunit